MSKYITNWFSNFLPFDIPMKYQGMVFHTPENFFQAIKCKEDDLEGRRKISLATPSQAKRLGRRTNLRPDWEDIKLEVMEYALRYKFAEGTTWNKKLLSVVPNYIEETNNWHDNFWGNCICARCKNIEGQNHLGKILMKIGKELSNDG